MQVPAVQEKPSITGFGWLWQAYQDLTTCRQIGMDVGPIPWTAIQRYVEVQDYLPEERYILHRVIQHLDGLFLKLRAEKNEAERKAKAPRTGAPRGWRR